MKSPKLESRPGLFIGEKWHKSNDGNFCEVVNPATEAPIARIGMGTSDDVDLAVKAAQNAFPEWASASREERMMKLQSLLEAYKERVPRVAEAITSEMGAPISLSLAAQAAVGLMHLESIIDALGRYSFAEERGSTLLVREAIGVCGLITPWNWPINQIMGKVAPALAVGCTVILKPSELAPLNAILLAEAIEASEIPPGVFNLVCGDGPTVGRALCTHEEIAMISFTGSTNAGVEVSKSAASSVKRVALELGGKSANIILDDANLNDAVTRGTMACLTNSGQSCNAPTRMLVPAAAMENAAEIAADVCAKINIGDPFSPKTQMGPLANRAQFEKVQSYMKRGQDEGARQVCGGAGRPKGLDRGYFVQPTVFADVSNDMVIAREEIFGPVLSIIPYESEEEAISIANDSPYGLAGYVSSGDIGHAREVASKLRAGQVTINDASFDLNAPFGGYKRSGNGREHGGNIALDEFIEMKAVLGYEPAPPPEQNEDLGGPDVKN